MKIVRKSKKINLENQRTLAEIEGHKRWRSSEIEDAEMKKIMKIIRD